MLAALAALSTPAAGQGGAARASGAPPRDAPAGGLTAGLVYTVGGSWQIQGFDVGYARAVHAGPLAVAAVGARLGEFINQDQIYGGSRGFVGGVTLATRTAMAPLAAIGADSAPVSFGVDLTLEATAYGAAHSPLPMGSFWGAVSFLPGLRIGNRTAWQGALLIGPTVFLGQVTQVRAFLGVRYEAALARGKRQP
jgi:hypothetical protein